MEVTKSPGEKVQGGYRPNIKMRILAWSGEIILTWMKV